MLLAFAGCKDDKKTDPAPDPASQKGTVSVQFENYVGSSPLELNSAGYYKNENGDSFKVSRYKYYVSNIVLKTTGGSTYTEAESYHLVDQASLGSLSFDLANVPAGQYTSLTLMIGVDSLRNVSGAQTGALDPAHGMFWTWNTGYIMAKMEGSSPQVPTSDKLLSFHIGGFSGAYNATYTVELPFPQTLTVAGGTSGKIKVKSDLLTWFKSPNLVNFATLYSIGSLSAESAKIGENYRNMFTVTGVQ